MKVFVLHRLENSGCCEADGGDNFSSEVLGVFKTKELAENFVKKDKYLKRWRVEITEVEFYKKDLDK